MTSLPATSETQEQTAKRIAHETRLRAIVNTSNLLDIITERGIDPGATFNQIKEALDANLKISGMLADKAADNGPRQALPSFVLKMSDGTTLVVGGGPEVRQGLTIEQEPDLPPIPDFLNVPLVSNLAASDSDE